MKWERVGWLVERLAGESVKRRLGMVRATKGEVSVMVWVSAWKKGLRALVAEACVNRGSLALVICKKAGLVLCLSSRLYR